MAGVERKNCFNCNSTNWVFLSEDQFGDTYGCITCGQKEGRIRIHDGTEDWTYIKYSKKVEGY